MIKELNRDKEIEPQRHLWIQLMGLPASGKTTISNYLGQELGMTYVGEAPVDDNPLFELYYSDPDKWSLMAQMYFLFQKRQQIVGFEQAEEIGIKNMLLANPVISEPPIYQDGLYAQARLESKPEEMRKYQDFFDGMVDSSIQTPDLIVYLRLKFPDFITRVRNRAEKYSERAIELEEKEEYWQRLWDLHEEWVNNNPLSLNIVTIDMAQFDFSRYDDRDQAKREFSKEFRGLVTPNLANLQSVILPSKLK